MMTQWHQVRSFKQVVITAPFLFPSHQVEPPLNLTPLHCCICDASK